MYLMNRKDRNNHIKIQSSNYSRFCDLVKAIEKVITGAESPVMKSRDGTYFIYINDPEVI